MIAISCWIFNVRTCRILKARAELGARPPPSSQTTARTTIHPASAAVGGGVGGGTCIERDQRARARILPTASAGAAFRSFVRAPAQTQGFREPGEQTSGSGGERKMEVRVGERLLCLAVLSSVLCVDSVFGKYVKGIVNTKEVRVCFRFLSVSMELVDTCDDDIATNCQEWASDSTAYPHAGVSGGCSSALWSCLPTLAWLFDAVIWHTLTSIPSRSYAPSACVVTVAYFSSSLSRCSAWL